MSQDPNALVYKWAIERVEDATISDPQTGFSRGKKILYRLADGTRSFVEVPLAKFSADHVMQLVEEAAEAHFQVVNLRSDETIQPSQLS